MSVKCGSRNFVRATTHFIFDLVSPFIIILHLIIINIGYSRENQTVNAVNNAIHSYLNSFIHCCSKILYAFDHHRLVCFHSHVFLFWFCRFFLVTKNLNLILFQVCAHQKIRSTICFKCQ